MSMSIHLRFVKMVKMNWTSVAKGTTSMQTLADHAKLDAEYFTVDLADYTAEGRSHGKLAVTKKIQRRISDGCRLSIEGEPEVEEF